MTSMATKPMCKYGKQCYRKNPIHFQEFDHPFKYPKTSQSSDDNNGQLVATSPAVNKTPVASSHSPANPNKRLKSSDDISTPMATIDDNKLGFYLTKVSGIDRKFNSLEATAISLKDILHERNGKLLESLQMNFMFEMDWLMDQYPKQFQSLPLLVVYGSKRDGTATRDMQSQCQPYPNVRLFGAHLVDAFGTHHTKMMFLRYDKGLRVIIHTANLIENDWTHKTQGVWISPLFPPLTTGATDADVSQTRFKTDLIEYLKSYTSIEINEWIQTIRRHDLSSAKVFLIGSVPGRHVGGDNIRRFGHMKLRRLLAEFGPSAATVDSSWPTIAQFSSIGSLGPTADKWLTNEFLTTLSTTSGPKSMSMTKPQLKIIFPSVDDVRTSLEGYSGGGSLPYSSQTHQKQPYLTSYLHRWQSERTGRSHACPHIKTYTRLSSDWKQMAYFVLTSANLSKAAWGGLERNGIQLAIRSYEIGVLFIPKLFANQEFFNTSKPDDPKQLSNTSSFHIPYDIPLTPYTTNDSVWTWDTPHTDLPDTHGNSWIPQ